MYRKNYVGCHGYATYVRGVWTVNDDGDRAVRVTSVGRIDDEIFVGDILTVNEIHGIVGIDDEMTDVFSYAERSASFACV